MDDKLPVAWQKNQVITATPKPLSLKVAQTPPNDWGDVYKRQDISSRCGYTSQRYFSRAFKRDLNMSPSEYRDTHKILN